MGIRICAGFSETRCQRPELAGRTVVNGAWRPDPEIKLHRLAPPRLTAGNRAIGTGCVPSPILHGVFFKLGFGGEQGRLRAPTGKSTEAQWQLQVELPDA